MKSKIQLYFFLILTFLMWNPINLFAQSESIINELKIELERTADNSHKADLYLKLASEFRDLDSALIYSRRAILLSDELHYHPGSIKARLIAGDCLRESKELNSVEYLLEARELLKNHNDESLKAWCYGSLAKYYYHLKPVLPEALKNAHKALSIYEKTQDHNNLIKAYIICGMIYSSQNEKEDALNYYEKAIPMAEKAKDSASIAYIHNCISDIYFDKSQYDESFAYSQKALSIYESLGDHGPVWGVAWTYSYIGRNYYMKANRALAEGNREVALKFFDEAFQTYNKRLELELQIKSGSVDSYLDLANWYIQMIKIGEANSVKDYVNTANGYLENCVRNAEKENSSQILYSAYLSKSVLDSIKGDYQSAFENFSRFITLKDSAAGVHKSEEALHLKMQYDFNKEQAIAQTELEKIEIRQGVVRNSLIAAMSCFFFFSVIVFRQRNKLKKEKNRSDDLLLNILPEEIADELKEKGQSQARRFDEVSVLVTDFVSFTQTTQTLTAQELVQELNECFTTFDNIIERNGLEKIKTIGDAYLAVCGLPSPDPKHAQKVVNAALEIRDFIAERNLQKKTFQIRIGAHSGSVVAGIIGVKKFAYDIWGETVYTASRMEQNGVSGKVNISETTYNLANNDFDFEYRNEIETKGKEKISMYFAEPKSGSNEFEKTKEFILKKLESELSEHLTYHNIDHILDVYRTSVQYAKSEGINEEDTILLKTASLFHDAGFIVQADEHERISCDIAQQFLPGFGYSTEQIDKIKGMIMATKIPQRPQNHLEQILADADLDYLGRDDFEKISERLFQELGIKSRNDWNKIQIAFFEKHSYFTDTAKNSRNIKKQENLEKIKEQTQL